MQPLLIVKTGSTFSELASEVGDFENWIERGLGLPPEATVVVDVAAGAPLPEPDALTGCVVTGSHDNVTDELDWMPVLAGWLRDAVQGELPILGICFGHQILAEALGGKAGFHPEGPEIGMAEIHLAEKAEIDPLFSQMPSTFAAHVTHLQSALTLPESAVVLACNAHEPHHAFRIGRHAWGVQFHPEFFADASRHYTTAQADLLEKNGFDSAAVHAAVVETPESTLLLSLFADYCAKNHTPK